MKIGYTINISNFESIKIQSSEYDNIKECLTECRNMLITHNIPKREYLTSWVDKISIIINNI